MTNTNNLTLIDVNNRMPLPRHTTLRRDPNTLLSKWTIYKDEVEKFVAWLKIYRREKKSTIYRYLVAFKKLWNTQRT